MKSSALWIAVVVGIALSPLAARAGDQQDRMKDCAKQYHEKNIPKNQYRSFMSQCLKKDGGATPTKSSAKAAPASTPPAVASASSQKDKMKQCNAEAKDKKLAGAARKAFMKNCLSGAPAGK